MLSLPWACPVVPTSQPLIILLTCQAGVCRRQNITAIMLVQSWPTAALEVEFGGDFCSSTRLMYLLLFLATLERPPSSGLHVLYIEVSQRPASIPSLLVNGYQTSYWSQ